MIINLIFDQNPPASFTSAITSAAQILDQAITDPITVTIEVGYGVFPTDHSPITGGAAEAEPNFALVSSASVSSVVSALNAGAAPGDTNFDALTSAVVASGGTAISGYNGLVTKPYSQVLLWSAEAKALGFIPANQGGIDGFAGFATDINPNSLVGVALHELTHALGRAPSGRGLQPFGDIPDIFDLFRFDSATNLPLVSGDFGESPPAYFSVNGPVNNGGTVLANYGENSDPGDFLNDSLTVNDPFDEFYVPGATFQSLTLSDLIQLDVLGFNTITFSWTNGASGDFASASNWTSAGSSPSTSTPTSADNVVITQSGAYTVSSWAKASNTIDKGGTELVSAGAIDSGALISRGTQFVYGSVFSGIILSGGSEIVSASGRDSGAQISSGTQIVFGLVGGATIVSGAQVSGGTLTVSSGGQAVASITLIGNYSVANFHVTSGIGGSVKITDPGVVNGGSVEIGNAQAFPGHGIDLPNIAFGAQTTLAYAQNGPTTGTLTVGDGRHAANLALLGNYMAGSFVAAPDGHGGTLVTQQSEIPQSLLLTHPHG